MKNQHFADRRDFYKHALLLHLMGCGFGFERLVMAWWLTDDDDSGDGEVRDYTAGRPDDVRQSQRQPVSPIDPQTSPATLQAGSVTA